MKILYVINSLWNSGGMERVLSVEANYLASSMGYDVTILTICQQRRPLFFPLSDNIKLKDLRGGYPDPVASCLSLSKAKDFLGISQKFSEIQLEIKKINPDIVVSLYGPCVFQNLEKKTLKVLWSHFSPDAREVMYGKKFGFIAACAARVMGKITRHQIRKYTDVHVSLTKDDATFWSGIVNRSVCIGNPITIDLPQKQNTSNSHRTISVARLDPLKGVDVLIQAWSKVVKKFPDRALDIFGTGVEYDKLKKQIEILKLGDSVSLHGSTNDIAIEYSSRSLFVSSSRSEGFPLVILEAMASGLPVVATSTNGAKEILGADYPGLVPIDDPDSLAKKICQVISDNNMRERLINFCLKKSQDFSLPTVMRKWETLFLESLALK